MKHLSLISLLLLVCLPLAAQQISVDEFTRLKGGKVQREKSVAILDLLTDEKGFTFQTGSNEAVNSQDWVGFVRLKLPNKTNRVLIRHPQYGQFLWYVPHGKKLYRNQHYQAVLYSADPTRDFKATHQWVVFRLNPENVILKVDSLLCPVRQQVAEFYLKVGPHSYSAEAPFFDPEEGRFTLSDSLRKEIYINLQPFYSYLTVKTEWEGGKLYIDNVHIRKKAATSYRLSEGSHRVDFFLGKQCVYDTLLNIGRAQKKVLEVKVSDLHAKQLRQGEPLSVNAAGFEEGETSVRVSSQDNGAQIWVDREKVGTGLWKGKLSRGYHLVQAVKDGQEDISVDLMIQDGFPIDITLPAAGIGYGLVNIHCNVDGASIRIDGEEYGDTPRIVRLEASRSYRIRLNKAGYRTGRCRVRPKGNGQVDVYLELKKR